MSLLSWQSVSGSIVSAWLVIPLSALAQLPPPPREAATDANGVDVRTGNVTFEARELDIGPDSELGLHLARYLNGGTARDSFDSTFYLAQYPDGNSTISASFGNIGDNFGTFGTDVGAFFDVSYDSPNVPAHYQHRSGVMVSFGRLMWEQNGPFGDMSYDMYRLADSVTYPSGLKIQIHYKFVPGPIPWVRIQSVTNNAGYQVKFRYASSSSTTRVAAIGINMAAEYCDPDADECSLASPWPTTTYSSSSTGTLSVTDAGGGVTTYNSIAQPTPPGQIQNRSLAIALPGSAAEVLQYTYSSLPSYCTSVFRGPYFCSMGEGYRVTKFENPEKIVTYSYNYNASQQSFDKITSTDPGNITNIYQSFGPGVLGMASITDANGRVQSFEYNQKGLITKATWPEGNYTEWLRDANGNVLQEKAHSKDNSQILTQTQTFGACAMGVPTCSLPISITDARLNTTDIRYNARGQKIAEIRPAGENGVRPLTRWVYVDRYAYIKASNGTLVQAEAPVSVLSKTIVCRSTFNGSLTDPACGSQADEAVTTLEYASAAGPNALLPIGQTVSADGQSLRTCYGYDLRGNRIWERSPRANAASCE